MQSRKTLRKLKPQAKVSLNNYDEIITWDVGAYGSGYMIRKGGWIDIPKYPVKEFEGKKILLVFYQDYHGYPKVVRSLSWQKGRIVGCYSAAQEIDYLLVNESAVKKFVGVKGKGPDILDRHLILIEDDNMKDAYWLAEYVVKKYDPENYPPWKSTT